MGHLRPASSTAAVGPVPDFDTFSAIEYRRLFEVLYLLTRDQASRPTTKPRSTMPNGETNLDRTLADLVAVALFLAGVALTVAAGVLFALADLAAEALIVAGVALTMAAGALFALAVALGRL
jgi:hypothetical protein